MPDCWVKVARSDGTGVGTAVFVNCNYVDEAGAIGTPFVVRSGQNTFETLAGTTVDWCKTLTIEAPPPGDTKDTPVPVTLEKASS